MIRKISILDRIGRGLLAAMKCMYSCLPASNDSCTYQISPSERLPWVYDDPQKI
jgi:hypothetical protein